MNWQQHVDELAGSNGPLGLLLLVGVVGISLRVPSGASHARRQAVRPRIHLRHRGVYRHPTCSLRLL